LSTYTQVVESLAALRVGSMDKQNVASRTIAELRACVLPELEDLPEVEESNTLN